jgi:hypothetical protein
VIPGKSGTDLEQIAHVPSCPGAPRPRDTVLEQCNISDAVKIAVDL